MRRRTQVPKLSAFTNVELTKVREVCTLAFPHGSGREIQEFQFEALLAFVRRLHTIVLAPMGAGKSMIMSLCLFWAMLIDCESIMVCIYPLIGLEEDQTEEFRTQHPAFNPIWYDATSKADQHENMMSGRHRILCVSPEVATSDWFLKMLRTPYFQKHLKLIVIDEIHLVRTWKFRSYSWLTELLHRRKVSWANWDYDYN